MSTSDLRTGASFAPTASMRRAAVVGAALIGAAVAIAAAVGEAQAQAPAAPATSAPAAASATPASTLGPAQLVEDSAKRMLTELDANRAMYTKDPAKLDALVGDVLLPNFDTEYSARLVLGQTWRTATEEQRKRFVDAFYHSLLRNYGNALVNFSLRKTDGGWKAWDVVIEGISYVKSFRTDFGAEIQQKGLDEVITRLEQDGTVRANGVAGGSRN